jgi:NDP-sugar pyrophosphorylase family protein
MKCVTLAAGEEKRMRSRTSRIPKVMIPVVKCLMREHLVRAFREAGIREILLWWGMAKNMCGSIREW